MSIEVYNYDDGRGDRANRLVSCPLCGYEFSRQERPPTHFLDEHGPEDIGLPPLGEVSEGVDGPLFPEEEVLQR